MTEFLQTNRKSWANDKFTLTDFFRQINYLVISSLVKPLLSRNFRNYHSNSAAQQCGKPRNISSNQLFSNLFSKTVTFTKFPHFALHIGKARNSFSLKKISSNQLFRNRFHDFFAKKVYVTENFCNFLTVL